MLNVSNLVGFGSGGASGSLTLMEILTNESLDGNTIFCLDFSSSSCYTSGQTISDLSGNGNDFWLGATSSSESSDPTFNAQGALSYFSFDGGDYMQMKAVPAALNGLHKNNATFSVVWVWRTTTGGCWFSTVDGTDDDGVIGFGASALRLQARNATTNALNETSAIGVTSGADAFCALALDEPTGGTGSHWRVNGSTDTFDGTYTSPSATNSSIVRIGATGSGGTLLVAGSRLYAHAVLDTDITTTQSGNIYSALQSRFGF